MIKDFLFIIILLVFASAALTPAYATSHEAKKAVTTTEATESDAAKADDATATDGEKKEEKEGEEDEEPDCD